jgi:hypothetical protein
MYVALPGSTGAWLTSTFHQLSAGNSGSGCGSGPAGCATAATPPSRVLDRKKATTRSELGDETMSARSLGQSGESAWSRQTLVNAERRTPNV